MSVIETDPPSDAEKDFAQELGSSIAATADMFLENSILSMDKPNVGPVFNRTVDAGVGTEEVEEEKEIENLLNHKYSNTKLPSPCFAAKNGCTEQTCSTFV